MLVTNSTIRFNYPQHGIGPTMVRRLGKVSEVGTGRNGDYVVVELEDGSVKRFSEDKIQSLKVIS